LRKTIEFSAQIAIPAPIADARALNHMISLVQIDPAMRAW